MRILLATDGSEHSEAAVDEIAQRPFPMGSQVRVISVVDPPYYQTTELWRGDVTNLNDMNLYDEMLKSFTQRASTAVEKAARGLRASHEGRELRVTTEVLTGSPKQVILDEAETFAADLIVVGSHGYGMIERFLLGSVSQAIALHAQCSVEIVRIPKILHEPTNP